MACPGSDRVNRLEAVPFLSRLCFHHPCQLIDYEAFSIDNK